MYSNPETTSARQSFKRKLNKISQLQGGKCPELLHKFAVAVLLVCVDLFLHVSISNKQIVGSYFSTSKDDSIVHFFRLLKVPFNTSAVSDYFQEII